MLNKIEFDFHKNYRSTNVPDKITLADYLNRVRLNQKPIAEKGTTEYEKIKSNTPTIVVNGYFQKNPSNDRFIKSTGYIFLEMDKLPIDEIEKVKSYWFHRYYFIVAAYKSLSQTGIHFIAKLDSKLTSEINAKKEDSFKVIIHTINQIYFEGKLDTQAFKLTQYTVLGSDEAPLFREHFDEISLSVEYRDVETTSTKEKAVSNSTSPTDIEDFDNLSRISKVKHLFKLYPIFKERYYWFIYDYGRTPAYLANAFTAWGEINNEGFSDKFYYRTQLSSDYFSGSNDVITIDEPIGTTCIKNFIKSKEGKRRDRLLVEASKILFNNPFIGYAKYFEILHELNLKVCSKPLSDNEVEDIAVRQYQSFISGSMKWNNLKERTVFYPDISILDKEEKSRITQRNTYLNQKNETIKLINSAIITLQNNGIKPTQKEVAKEAEYSIATVKRHWKYVKVGIKASKKKT